MMRRSFWDYINETLTSSDSDGPQSFKRFWSYIKRQRTAKTGVSPLKVNGRLISDPKEKVEVLNSQFQSAFSEGRTYSRDEFQTNCKLAEGATLN